MPDGLITIDKVAGALPEQIYNALAQAIRAGQFPHGQVLPSSRGLAGQLGVSRNTANAAYELLRADGLVSIMPGARPRVAYPSELEKTAVEPATAGAKLSRRGEGLATDLRSRSYMQRTGLLEPGTPDETSFPLDEWARALRRAARRRYGDDSTYANTAGLPLLRETLATYLARSRGLVAVPEQVLIVPSIQAGLMLASQCLTDRGDAVWHETPGYIGAKAAFHGAGLEILPMQVDGEGANPSSIPRGSPHPKLIYVTPSHQYPTSVRMTLPRRQALLAQAREHGAVILEDDYDSEFLWQGRAIAALQGISGGENVVYFGTTAKSMLPGLRLAYMVVPRGLAEAFRMALRNTGILVNVHVQAAFADFITSGHYAAHLRRISRLYEERGKVLTEAVNREIGGDVKAKMPPGGLQVTLDLPDHTDDEALSRALAKARFNVPPLSAYCTGEPRRGLVVGFSAIDPKLAQRFVDTLKTGLQSGV